ncbi:hypothetical protein [Runella sp. SP2]|uniref:hypothetical protein n=1 Tax=Runella sp. SP2 TaxID=2268026 RepID=UPI00197E167D|nr:hypothetical protein [Runella sp. SP2]
MLSLVSCRLDEFWRNVFPCSSRIPQAYKLGSFDLNVKTTKPKLHIGDTVYVNLAMNQHVYDSLTRENVKVSEQVALWIKVWLIPDTTYKKNNPFATDTTIARVFDQYFTMRVLKGKRNNAYHFDCELKNGVWLLELQYIAKKKGQYELLSNFDEIKAWKLPKGVCMLGSPYFNAQVNIKSTNNQIGVIYPLLPSYRQNHFGFIVE